MKKIPQGNIPFNLLSIVTGVLLGATASQVQAATISPTDPVPSAGISYEWTVEMGDRDRAELTRHVGAKSWNEPDFPVGLKGWTHTSDWIALELTQATQLTVKITRKANVPIATGGKAGDSLYPAFSLYSGWDETTLPELHQYNTVGDIPWTNKLSYLAHQANGGATDSIFGTFTLAAGDYSLAIGGDPPAGALTQREGYRVTLISGTTVPEPNLLGALSIVAAAMVLTKSLRGRQ